MVRIIFRLLLLTAFILTLLINLYQLRDIQLGFLSLLIFIIIICTLIILAITEPNYIKLVYSKFTESANANYIDGEAASFYALTETTSKAKDTIRATRFFPISVLAAQDYVQAMERRILGRDGKKPLKNYYRIVAVNNREKQNDIFHHLNRFCGKPFKLYLTTHQNDFELVIVDESDAFVCFYKEEKVVASSLHVQGKMLVREFIGLFDNLRKKDIIKEFDCLEIKIIDLDKHFKGVRKLFDKHC